MKNILYVLVLLFFAISCENYPDSRFDSNFFNYTLLGNNQSAKADNYLTEEVGIQITPNSSIINNDFRFKVEMEVVEGGGKIDNYSFESAGNEPITTRWKLGSDGNNQTILGNIYDMNGHLYSRFEISASAYVINAWNTVTQGNLVGIQDMVYDTVQQKSMLISVGKIYESTDKFYNWSPVYLNFNTNVKELEINSKGEVFAAGWNGKLYKTSDWGESWNQLGNPIPENPYHYELTITKDDYIWANKWDHGVYCSKDNGLTWQKDTSGLVKQEQLGRIFSFADSAHMAISSHNLTILKTVDDGLTWTPINTPQYSLSMFVTDENEIIAQNQNGFHLHKSVDGGKTYKEILSVNVAFGTQSIHCFEKFKNDYYVLAPGGGVWKTRNFEEFEELVRFDLQRNLYIDHRGAIYVCGFNYSNAEDEPTLIYLDKD